MRPSPVLSCSALSVVMFQRHTEAVEQSPRERTEVMTGMRAKNEIPGMTLWGVRGGAKLPTAEQESQEEPFTKGAFSLSWARGRGPIWS